MAGAKGRSGRKPEKPLVAAGDIRLKSDLVPPITPPAFLPQDAKKEYRRIAKYLRDRDRWTEIFSGILSIYVQAWMDWKIARMNLEAAGLVVEKDNGDVVANAWLGIAKSSEATMLKVGGEMGLTLAGMSKMYRTHSRERVVVEETRMLKETETWEETGLLA